MATKLGASRLLILKAARLLDNTKDSRKKGAKAKLFATEAPLRLLTMPYKFRVG